MSLATMSSVPRNPELLSRAFIPFLKASRGADPDMDPDMAGVGPGRNYEDPDVAGMGPGRNHEDPDVAGAGPGRNREGLGTARGPRVMLSCGPYHGPKNRGQKTWESKLRILGPPPKATQSQVRCSRLAEAASSLSA